MPKPRTTPRLRTDEAQGSLRGAIRGLEAFRASAGGDSETRVADIPSSAPAEAPSSSRSVYAAATKLVVRRERKGHGGKTATRIEGLVGSTRELEEAVRDVKRALGCGAALDGRDVVVQGDQGERLLAFLAERGARKVVVGS